MDKLTIAEAILTKYRVERDEQERKASDDTWAKWEAAGRKCSCGNPIEFEHAYQYGECLQCFQAVELAEYWADRLADLCRSL